MAVDQGSVLAGRFAVGELLGRGGMADVYRGEDQVLGRAVAIKVFRGVEGNESERARFEAEGRTLAGLSHPGLVTLLDVGTDQGNEFLVMELVDGPSLSTRLGRPLPEGEVADMGRQVAQALAYAHGQGVIHRDIKPGNILLGSDGRVKIADFGIARLVDQATQHTQEGMAIGSPAYLAPEQVMGTEVTGAADVWSLGLVLLECLTGRREYAGPSTEAAMARLHRAPAVPDDLPDGWRALLRAMTAPEPEDRPDAAQVATAIPEPGQHGDDTMLLTQAVPAGTDPESTQPWSPAGAVPSDTAEQPRRTAPTAVAPQPEQPAHRGPRWMLVAAAVAAALLVAVVVLVLVSGDDSPPDETEVQIPDGVPTRYEEPLTDLHEAIHGSPQ
jgi:serine/threonine protein kinase